MEIRRTTSLRGAGGEIAGRIEEIAGKTVAAQVDDLWWMKSRPYKELRLIMGDLNIPVTTWEMWAAFDPETSMVHRIDTNARFGFAQTDDDLPFWPI
jgi:hypothetical protein